MSGILYGVGVGPGDPELLTIKAARIIGAADVVAYLAANGGESLARSIASPHIKNGVEEISINMPMKEDPQISSAVYDACAEQVAARLELGQNIAFLCEGDPLFFGSFMYVLDRLSSTRTVQIVPGVSSLAASSAALCRPLTRRNDTLKVLPATLRDDQLRAEMSSFSAIAIIKVGRHLSRIRALLGELDLLQHATAVERASQSAQRMFSLADSNVASTSYFTTIIVQKPDHP